jgi:hypothetical protein
MKYNVEVFYEIGHYFPWKWIVWEDGCGRPDWFKSDTRHSAGGGAGSRWGAKWAAKRAAKRLAKMRDQYPVGMAFTVER